MENETLDIQTIKYHIPEIKNKVKWIDLEIKKLTKVKDFKNLIWKAKNIKKILQELVDIKHNFNEEDKGLVREKILRKSQLLKKKFFKEFSGFLNKGTFLLGYRFPVDHFQLRKNYDNSKSLKGIKNKKSANKIYFYRKIVEDGAFSGNNKRSDLHIRTNLNSIYIRLNNKSDFVQEDIRYDIDDVMNSIENLLKRGKRVQLARMKNWKTRTYNSLKFYQFLIKSNNKKALEEGRSLLQKKFSSQYALQNFNQSKQEETYLFWKDQSDLMRALFSIETILFNEVGSIDGNDALERKDVTKVVINRSLDRFYSTLSQEDKLYENLVNKLGPKLSNYKWLNVLFKTGEFSFTYFYIPGSVRVYCPELTRNGKFLRKQNLRIALDGLSKYDNKFTGIRYFSRASMLGRIDMSSIWSDYKALEEEKGVRAPNSSKLKKRYRKNQFKYLYQFKDSIGESYDVIQFGEKIYVKPIKNNHAFYRYRNPHHFRYFEYNPKH